MAEETKASTLREPEHAVKKEEFTQFEIPGFLISALMQETVKRLELLAVMHAHFAKRQEGICSFEGNANEFKEFMNRFPIPTADQLRKFLDSCSAVNE